MKSQATFFNDDVRPDLGNEVSFADDLVWAGYQSHQNVERSPIQLYPGTVPHEEPFARDQAERPERDGISGHCASFRRLTSGISYR
jgi:hypothetical protein